MKQKSAAEERIEARVAKLKEMGLDDKQLAKDPLLRQAKAALKKANDRLKAIDAKDALTQELAARKEQAEVKKVKTKVKTKGKASEKGSEGKNKPKSKEKKVKAKKA